MLAQMRLLSLSLCPSRVAVGRWGSISVTQVFGGCSCSVLGVFVGGGGGGPVAP